MHHYFEDIISRIKESPLWWDSNGTPRYGEFKPEACPNIYAKEIVLLLIRCQNCKKEFKVEMHMDMLHQVNAYNIRKLEEEVMTKEEAKEFVENHTLAVWIKAGVIHYGDPPRHDHDTSCQAGQSMNCEDIKVLEYWKRESFKYVRDPALEIMVPEQDE